MMNKKLNDLIGIYASTLDHLMLLRNILETGDCNTCKNEECQWKPQAGQMVRYNCPHYMQLSRADRDQLKNAKWVDAIADDIKG